MIPKWSGLVAVILSFIGIVCTAKVESHFVGIDTHIHARVRVQKKSRYANINGNWTIKMAVKKSIYESPMRTTTA